MTTGFIQLWTGLLCLTLCFGHDSRNSCAMDADTCEFYLYVTTWLPMRRGFNQKVYINESDGNVYIHGDQSRTPVDPDDVVLADGSKHERVLTLFNKTMPGPTLTVYRNQEVIVHVTNHMLSDGVTIHFHGIEMRGTPWMDGAAFITQCPILPGQTFSYRFRPNRKGTYFYHSHTGAQTNMGLVGAFIVKEKKQDEMKEYVMVVQDYSNLYDSDRLYTAGVLLGIFSPDGVPFFPSYERIDGSNSPLLEFTSSLINGRGRVLDQQGGKMTKTPLSTFNVEKGLKYKFRIVGGGYGIQHKLSVDGHKLKVVATDGNDIEPITADFVIMHSGERFDIVIEASEAVGNYWIRADTLHKSINLTGLAILRYEGAVETDPESGTNECTESSPCTVVNCPFETFPNWNCITSDKMRAPDTSDPAPTASSGNFKEFFVNVGYALSDNGEVWGHMGGISLKLPTVSALTQPMEVTGICDNSNSCGPNKVCFCNHPLDVNFGDIVQMTFYSAGFLNIVHHPIHVHGYSFHVVKVGFKGSNANFTADINCPSGLCYSDASWVDRSWKEGNIPDVDVTRLPRKDTVTLPAGGYVVIRFMADNPGLWFIHCHQEMHMQIGMGLLLNDSFPQIPSPPPGFPECRNYPPPTILKPTRNNSDDSDTAAATTTTERTFSREEFWGMFGAMLFVVVLQFILAMTCNRRSSQTVKF
ncbi:uncharacterized protein LOC123541253 [Mercenaria mercenaria]|uniref:uncharacterized protein LOC123541253 n=1 Tax=Mercenaria mercenaria TaxID=6596 RepID=UPI00234EB321|nr:uncharacterized protein LOC123541253 [Mercenaria mercenaria]